MEIWGKCPWVKHYSSKFSEPVSDVKSEYLKEDGRNPLPRSAGGYIQTFSSDLVFTYRYYKEKNQVIFLEYRAAFSTHFHIHSLVPILLIKSSQFGIVSFKLISFFVWVGQWVLPHPPLWPPRKNVSSSIYFFDPVMSRSWACLEHVIFISRLFI